MNFDCFAFAFAKQARSPPSFFLTCDHGPTPQYSSWLNFHQNGQSNLGPMKVNPNHRVFQAEPSARSITISPLLYEFLNSHQCDFLMVGCCHCKFFLLIYFLNALKIITKLLKVLKSHQTPNPIKLKYLFINSIFVQIPKPDSLLCQFSHKSEAKIRTTYAYTSEFKAPPLDRIPLSFSLSSHE